MNTELDDYDDNIEAQLDMAVDSADDIGDFSAPSEGTDEASDDETIAAPETQDAGGVVEPISGAEPNTQPQTQTPEVPAVADGTPVAPRVNKGDLVDEHGQVLAAAGPERRVYERSQKIQNENNDLHAQLNALKQTQNTGDEFTQSPEKLGLSREDALVGVQLMHNLKTNPVEAARNILQTAVAQGHSLQSILGDVEGLGSSTVDMGAIKHMIDEKLAPITAREQQETQRVEQQTRTRENAQQFFRTHEFSELHVDAITNLMQNNKNITPDQAYYEVKTYALQNGLDFTQPLKPQVIARQPVPGQAPVAPTIQAPHQPMPNGNASSIVETQSPTVANGDDDWDSILRDSMTESGMQFNQY